MKKIIFFIAVVLVVVLGVGAFFAAKKIENLLPINQTLLQGEIDQHIPMSGDEYGVVYEVVKADLVLNDNIQMHFIIKAEGHGYKGLVDATVIGVPRYDKHTKLFYFEPDPKANQPFTFHDLEMKKGWAQRAKDALDWHQGIVERIVRSKVDAAFANNVNARVAAERLIRAYMEKLPVAKMPTKTAAMKIAAVAVQDVRVVGDEIKIDISFLALTKYVLVMLVAFAMAAVLAIGLVMSGAIWPVVILGGMGAGS